MTTDVRNCDLLVIGSGAASICAALLAKAQGKHALIVEKTDKIGGSTALSGGVIWIPNNPLMTREGVADSFEQAWKYLAACAGDVGPASSEARRRAFLTEAPKVVEFLEKRGMRFFRSDGWSDYHESELSGGIARGRTLEARMFDLRALGPLRYKLRRHAVDVPITVPEMGQVSLNGRTLKSKLTFIKVGWRMLRKRLGQDLVRRGGALQGRLLQIAQREGVEIWTGASCAALLTEDGRVTGARIERDSVPTVIHAAGGVLINAGGFSHNAAMRDEYQPRPASTQFTASNPGDTGEVIEMAMRAGAATDLMDLSWWLPSSRRPDGTLVFHNPIDMAKPHAILVDGNGERYVDEGTSYVAVGLAMYNRNKSAPAVPSWFVVDSRHRNRYRYGGGALAAGATPDEWIASGYMKKAGSIADLAQQCGIDPVRLQTTIARFNELARIGDDHDFGKGKSAYHRFWGDASVRPHPNLGTVEEPPFYAVQIYPGDVGTAGGLLTDEFARVLRQDGSPIAGLYATGNSTASVMGRSYPGAGASIGASLVFGWIGARHALQAG